jgi:hypothetical protein
MRNMRERHGERGAGGGSAGSIEKGTEEAGRRTEAFPLSCEFYAGGRRQVASVLDASPEALLLDTDLRLEPGTPLHVTLRDAAGLALSASGTVTRRLARPAAPGGRVGLGLRIDRPSRECMRFLSVPRPVAPPPVRQTGPVAKTHAASFRVIGKHGDRPRLRDLVVGGRCEEEARERALAHLGEGWRIVEIRRT